MLDKEFKKINNNSYIISCQKTQKFIKSFMNFGYDTKIDILNDLEDEINELKCELFTENIDRIKEEIGDVIFVLCNLANQCSINLEDAINYSTKEFQRRLIYIENKVGEEKIKNIKMAEIIKLWREAKNSN